MIRHEIVLLALCLLPVFWCMDSILITSIGIKAGQLACTSSNLWIDGKNDTSLCRSDGSQLYLTYNQTDPITNGKNNTFLLETKNIHTNETANYTGFFAPDDKMKANVLAIGIVILNKEITATTTTTKDPNNTSTTPPPFPNEATLTINYVHLKYDDSNKKVVEKTNGGAVAVAIIEGIALIAILAYMGYKTMVKHRMKETTMNAAMYGYDNNSRITVPDSIRMSDVPPPRDPTYATPPTPTVQQQQLPTRNTVMTTQELVVPASTASPAARPVTSPNGQFSDPFDSLDSW